MRKSSKTYPPRKSLLWRAILRLVNLSDTHFPWHKWPLSLGSLVLTVRRSALNKFNLIPVGAAQKAHAAKSKKEKGKLRKDRDGNRKMYRTDDGGENDVIDAGVGERRSLFGRNTKPDGEPDKRDIGREPDVFVVVEKLLNRPPGGFKPAGLQLNVMAAAWIQAMIHDWMNHEQDMDKVTELECKKEGGGCPLGKFRFRPTKFTEGGSKNMRTAWWDASFVYGQDENAVKRARSGHLGKLKEGSGNRLAVDEKGNFIVGDQINSWVGVTLLQELFVKEHNAVCDMLAKKYPSMTDDQLFQKARLVVAAIVAKIHTIDWTIELLKTKTLRTVMRANWYGILGQKAKEKLKIRTGSAVLSGLTELRRANDHGIPFSLTEEFNAVYRMHPLMPDAIPLKGKVEPLDKFVGPIGQKTYEEYDPLDIWQTCIKHPCGALTLFNYPQFMRNLHPTNDAGEAVPEKIDLAALELYRDRERGLLKYNDFRRALNMRPMKTFEELTGKDTQTVEALKAVYTEGIESLDLLVGLLAEKKIPGFAISETAFHIFVVMASRRLEADRFFTQDFNPKVYTKEGFEWVRKVVGLKDVLARHYPSLQIRKKSAFTPWEHMPK